MEQSPRADCEAVNIGDPMHKIFLLCDERLENLAIRMNLNL